MADEHLLLHRPSVSDTCQISPLMPNRARSGMALLCLRLFVATLIACRAPFASAMPPQTPLASRPDTASAAISAAPQGASLAALAIQQQARPHA